MNLKGGNKLVPIKHRNQVEKYITGVTQKRHHKLLAIYCVPDHLHILIGLHSAQSIYKLVEETKKASRTFTKEQSWMPFDFDWQRGYGDFSYSKSQTDAIVKYVLNQEEHHRTRTFQEHYIDISTKLEIDFEKQYLFDFYDD